jgi:hypothetical protein
MDKKEGKIMKFMLDELDKNELPSDLKEYIQRNIKNRR